MKLVIYCLLSTIVFYSCKEDTNSSAKKISHKNHNETNTTDSLKDKGSDANKSIDTIKAPASFSNQGFDSAMKYELLIESRICNPNYSDTVTDGSVPCSAKFFRFFEYNHKRELDDAFMLQVKAGVNNYPYRRLLIFTREKGKLVLVNGITGYLVSQIKRENDIDDLIVGIIDDLGNDTFDRYDVLLRYKDGKYHVEEALGDLEGEFKNDKLKKRATQMIKQRIEEKNLIF